VVVVFFAIFLAGCQCQQWELLAPDILTIAWGVSAPNEKTVFASGGDSFQGGAMLKSVDGGLNWNAMSRDQQMAYFAADAANENFVAGGGLGFYGQTAFGSVATDGQNLQAMPFSALFSMTQSVEAILPSNVYMAGWYYGLRGDYGEGVLVSRDSGKTATFYKWNSPGMLPRYGSYPSNTTWYLAGGAYPTEAKKGDPDAPIYFNHRIKIHSKPDGELSFEIMNDISHLPKNGYHGTIERTLDGGKTFETLFNESGRLYFNGVDCLDELNCWIAGEGPEGAWIYKTSDGFRTIVEQLFLPLKSISDLDMIDANEGWAVGGEVLANTFNAIFLHTIDGGKTWTSSNIINNCYANALSVVNSNLAYATGFMRNGYSSILIYH